MYARRRKIPDIKYHINSSAGSSSLTYAAKVSPERNYHQCLQLYGELRCSSTPFYTVALFIEKDTPVLLQ